MYNVENERDLTFTILKNLRRRMKAMENVKKLNSKERSNKHVRIVDLCACRYEADNFVEDLPGVLMKTTPMTINVNGNSSLIL